MSKPRPARFNRAILLMVRLSLAEYMAYEARQDKTAPQWPEDASPLERDLHDKIFDECRRRSWICLHGSMSERTHRTAGEPDFTILADEGRVFFIECKSRKGKLSKVQKELKTWAGTLRHEFHEVRTYKKFLEIIGPLV